METGQQKEAMWKEEGADDSDTLLLTLVWCGLRSGRSFKWSRQSGTAIQ